MNQWEKMTPAQRKSRQEQVRAWQKANPDKMCAYSAAWVKANREKTRILAAAWAKANPEKAHAKLAAWRKANPEKMRSHSARRRARRCAAIVPLTPQEQAKVIGIYAEARALTEMIGTPYHVDHIIPLSKGGLHHPNNLQVLRGVDNLRKGAKL